MVENTEGGSMMTIEINNKTKLVNVTKQRQKLERRIPKEGFPSKVKFTSIEEIDKYLNSDRILCLLCGRSFKMLCTHISSIHKIGTDEYKEMFGLPYNTGLSSSSTRELMRENGLRPQQIEHMKTLHTPENKKRMFNNAKTQRTSLYKKMSSNINVAKAPLSVSKFNESHLETIISYMEKNNCSLSKAILETKIMKPTAFRSLLKMYPNFNYEERKKNVSKGLLNPIYKNEESLNKIKELRNSGMKFKDIALQIGIHEETAIKLYHGKKR